MAENEKKQLTWQEFLAILIESPLYFLMSIKDRKSYLVFMEETYGRLFS